MSEIIEQKKKALQQEIENLREEFYVELPKRIAEARSLGDLKENSEYDAARERQGFVKARINQLSRVLAQYSEASASSKEENIVHPAEFDPDAGKLSISSPVGRALQDRTVGEEVVVTVPAGEKRFFIEKITSLQGNVFSA